MLATRLVTMIERHADALTRGVIQELRTNPLTPSYHELDLRDIHGRVFDVVSHLGDWLGRESEAATETAYRKLGQERFREGIALAEVVSALTLTKETLRRFIKAEGWLDSALELYQQIELYDMISYFFDRAIYFSVLGYEEEEHRGTASPSETRPRRSEAGWTLRRSPHVV